MQIRQLLMEDGIGEKVFYLKIANVFFLNERLI